MRRGMAHECCYKAPYVVYIVKQRHGSHAAQRRAMRGGCEAMKKATPSEKYEDWDYKMKKMKEE